MASFKKYLDKNEEERWMFQAYLGTDPATGKKVKTTRRGFKRKKEAQLCLDRLQSDFNHKGLARPQIFTFQELYDQWLVSYRNTVKSSTFVTATSLFNNHILPAFGNRRIDKITIPYVQQVVNQWAKQLVIYKQLLTYSGLVFKYAMRLEIIDKDPTKLVTHPKVKKNKSPRNHPLPDDWENYYNETELQHFFDCLDDDANRHHREQQRVLFKVLALTGMREGELMALTWANVDLTDDVIHIKATTANKVEGYGLQSPKTASSIRSIDITSDTARLLKKWQLQQRQLLLMQGFNANGKDQLVFSNRENKHLRQGTLRLWLVRIIDKYELKYITVHGLRHSYASLLFASDVNIKAISKLMGHTDIKVTMDKYTHLYANAKKEAVQTLEKHLNLS